MTELVRLRVRAKVKWHQLSPVIISPSLDLADLVLVAVTRDDAVRLPYWLNYYRALGVEDFVIVNNESTDGTLRLLEGESGMTVFNAKGSFKSAHFGIDWVNSLLARYCRDKWVLFVDTDEYLAYDGVEGRDLRDLMSWLESAGATSLQCMMVDLYSDKAASQNVVDAGEDPLTVCRLYDPDGYNRIFDPRTRTTWIKGGPRARAFFSSASAAPALNKTPLVRWARSSLFVQVAHRLWPVELNDSSLSRGVTGALLHQKFLSDVGAKLMNADHVAQHDDEYLQYGDFGEVAHLSNERSHVYESSRSLLDDGLMTRIPW